MDIVLSSAKQIAHIITSRMGTTRSIGLDELKTIVSQEFGISIYSIKVSSDIYGQAIGHYDFGSEFILVNSVHCEYKQCCVILHELVEIISRRGFVDAPLRSARDHRPTISILHDVSRQAELMLADILIGFP